MLRFQYIQLLYLLALIPLMTLVYLLFRRWQKKATERWANKILLKSIRGDYSKAKSTTRFVFFTIATLFLIVAIADPQEGSKLEQIKKSGIDIMICLDVSNSMKAEDLGPNRLENAKRAISQLIEKLKGDRIGIIVFGGDAYVQLPITTDYAAAKMFLSGIDTDIIPTQGTAIGNAIDLAKESFSKESKNKKAIIVLTDGENHEDDALKSAEDALASGVLVYTIGMGSPEGTPIPVYKGGYKSGFKKDNQGNTVVTKLNEPMLQQIAAAGKGIYVRATNSNTGFNYVLEALSKLDKTEYESKMYSDYEDRFQYFAAVAFLFLLLEFFMSNKKSNLFERLGLTEKNELS